MKTNFAKKGRRFSHLTLSFIIFFTVGNGIQSTAQGFLHTKDTLIVDGVGNPVQLRGMGLGGWMLQEGYMLKVDGIGQQQHVIRRELEKLVGKEKIAKFYEAWLGNHTTKKDIEALKKWGFNSVRLPIHYALYTLPIEAEPIAGKDTWLKKGFELTDSLLAWCKTSKMYLILDLHAAPGGQGYDLNISDADTTRPFLWNHPDNQRKTIALWEKLAEKYKNEPWIGGYDILNEPNFGFTNRNTDRHGIAEQENKPLLQLYKRITKAIRAIDKNHLIIIEGNGWGNNYAGMLPPWDKNMVLSFHKYWNPNTTSSITTFLNYRRKYNLPLWLGETGENSNPWFTDAIRLVESHQIGWCWWPLKKIGHNNPLQIPMNEGFEAILNYWAGKTPPPNQSVAYAGLMQLANDCKFEKCTVQKDVVDAMFRQVKSTESRSFAPNKVNNGAVVPAVGYDLGRLGTAYFDVDSNDINVPSGPTMGNKGRLFRNDAVDIALINNDLCVNNILPGEWLHYTLQIQKAGKYVIHYRVSSNLQQKGRILTTLGKTNFYNEVPATKENDWQIIAASPIQLSVGQINLRVLFETGGFAFKDIRFELVK